MKLHNLHRKKVIFFGLTFQPAKAQEASSAEEGQFLSFP
jgi:hypothetical protein